MQNQPYRMEWDGERLLRALHLVVEEQAFSPLRKRIMKKKLAKLIRSGRFNSETLDSEWMYRICAASLMLHDYHWFAWEWRSAWAVQLATRRWCYEKWDGARCRLLVVGEQGLGDELVFSTCYHDLAKDVEEAWIEVDPRLLPIMERSMPENLHFVNRYMHPNKVITPRQEDYPEFHKDLPIDAFIPAANVPKVYRRALSDFPRREGHLKADPLLQDKWAGYAGATGWSWKGRQGELPIGQRDGISLQYGESEHHGLEVPACNLKRDLEDIFAIISVLGRVVCTTNAVAHMAGGIGTPTDCIKPPPIYATQEDGFNNRVTPWWPADRCDWYPSITMYRGFEQWTSVRRADVGRSPAFQLNLME